MALADELQELLTFYQGSNLREAEQKAKYLSSKYPDHPFAWKVLGAIYARTGHLQDALQINLHVVGMLPNDADAHNNLGIVQKDLGKLNDSKGSLERSIQLKKDFAEAHSNLGNTLYAMNQFESAEQHHREALNLKPNFPSAHYNLGKALQALGQPRNAEISYKKAIEGNPNSASAHNNLGIVLQQQNKLREAEKNYLRAVEIKPNYAEAHRHLALLKTFTDKDQQCQTMLKIYVDESISDEEKCHINFGLAKAYEDLKETGRAFQHYLEGNARRKRLLNYAPARDIELFDQIKTSFLKLQKCGKPAVERTIDVLPIFILGMPRSGTTLIEQIITSHHRVMGGGELPFAQEFGFDIVTETTKITDATLRHFREKYISAVQARSEGFQIVTDKMPQNFQYIGLISAALPEAKIVHVYRRPPAVCWANFKQFFAVRGLGYSYNLEDVVTYYRLYFDLMKFWSNSLPQEIYHVNYDRLTEHQEHETRSLIEHIGLDWDDACLTPHSNSRALTTASNLQVRRQVYRGSSKQWEIYRPYLQGVFDDLREFSFGDSAGV